MFLLKLEIKIKIGMLKYFIIHNFEIKKNYY